MDSTLTAAHYETFLAHMARMKLCFTSCRKIIRLPVRINISHPILTYKRIAVLGSIGTAIQDKNGRWHPTGSTPGTALRSNPDTGRRGYCHTSNTTVEVSAQILATANDAFVTGMQVNSFIGALVAAALAFLSAAFLQNVKGGGH